MEREAKIQDKLKDLIEIAVSKGYGFSGLRIAKVDRDWPVDSKEVDLAVFTSGDLPFIFIETKRKEKGRESSRFFAPLDPSVVGQVMSYAAIYMRKTGHLVPFVITANPDKIAVFKTPEDILDLVDMEKVASRDYKRALKPRVFSRLQKRYLERYEKLWLTEEYVIGDLLEKLSKQFVEKKEIKAKPAEVLINRCKEFVDEVANECAPLLETKIDEEPFKSEALKFGLSPTKMARMMAYTLMNKIIFHKVIEQSFPRLPPLQWLDSSSSFRFLEDLERHIQRAIQVTGDFQPIFRTGVYDKILIPGERQFMEYINDFILYLNEVDLLEIADKIGYMYEELIPPEERHQLGQFYTPPWVCELITRWCVRGSEDTILDPGVGSGGFILNAYERLKDQKLGKRLTFMVPKDVHENILKQLYALDINAFPVHLTSMSLEMRNFRAPSTLLNVVVEDFFSLEPGQKVFSPYKVPTIVGEKEHEIFLQKFDAVVGNPPYTRWTEIPDGTQKLIRERLAKSMKKYKLTPQVSRGVEPGIYTYWIMHATDFLKESGRLGMIISNTWLQTDYGVGFANFLLDNFRIKAIIDFGAKLFKEALVTTCIVLAEKESNKAKRLENKVVFIYVPPEKIKSPDQVKTSDIEELLEAADAGESMEYNVTTINQEELPNDRKWIDMFFKTVDISNHPLMTKIGELSEPSHGNVGYLYLVSTGKMSGVRNLGSSEFHYLSPSGIKEHKLEEWSYPQASLKEALLYPALTSARHGGFFTVNENDWKKMQKSDGRCYMFVCHKPKKRLAKNVLDYIVWGETECRAKGAARQIRGKGRLANETEAAKVRARETKHFYGWYDVGEVIPANILAIRRAWRKTKFLWCNFPFGISGDAFIVLLPRKNISFDETRMKALLAYLNSNFAQYYIETMGLKSPGGIIQLDAGRARGIPVLDVRKLSTKQLENLANLFEELEREARKIGGTTSENHIEKLNPKIYEIDRAVAALLGIKGEDVKNVENQVDLMVERRVSVAKRAK